MNPAAFSLRITSAQVRPQSKNLTLGQVNALGDAKVAHFRSRSASAIGEPLDRITIEPGHRACRGVVRMGKGALASSRKPDLQQDPL